jgi:hypothetical protein
MRSDQINKPRFQLRAASDSGTCQAASTASRDPGSSRESVLRRRSKEVDESLVNAGLVIWMWNGVQDMGVIIQFRSTNLTHAQMELPNSKTQ